jgi:serine protease Do
MLRNIEWRHFFIGFVGVIVGAVLVYSTLARTPRTLNCPVVRITRKVDPSVVIILNQQKIGREVKVRGIGSGVVLNTRGDIVTNYHVVAEASSLLVVLSNGRRLQAQLIGEDPLTDLAVIRIHAQHLRPIVFASSRNLQPGELVVAIGNALGLAHTVTTGIISAPDRVMDRDGWEVHLIQTDAAINPGNSGGALVNAHGQLIGINSSKIAQIGVEGIGFAIPSDTVKTITQQLMQFGHVRRPWIGATVDSSGRQSFGLLVVQVVTGSPAAEAGIKTGDFIVSVNGMRVRQQNEFTQILQKFGVGRQVRFGLVRGSQALQVTVTLADLPLQRINRTGRASS